MDIDEFTRSGLDALLRFARVVSMDRAEAEDVVQDVVLALHERAGRLDGIEDLNAYARRMVTNALISRARRAARMPRWLGPAVPPAAADTADSFADRDWVRSKLARLPARQRVTVAMRYYLDMSDAAIAAELGCSVSTVRSQISRALQVLRIELNLPQDERTEEAIP